MTAQTPVIQPAPAGAPGAAPIDEVVVEPSSGWPSLELREVWRAHELLYFLAWRDVKVRYKQTALGIAWVVLQPLLTVVFFTIFFNRIANISTGGRALPGLLAAAASCSGRSSPTPCRSRRSRSSRMRTC